MVRTVASPSSVICPLLVSIEKRSISDIENQVRTVLNSETEVKSVDKVTVHFIDNALVSVEAVIKVDESLTVREAKSVAQKLRQMIKVTSQIHQADVYFGSSDDSADPGDEEDSTGVQRVNKSLTTKLVAS